MKRTDWNKKSVLFSAAILSLTVITGGIVANAASKITGTINLKAVSEFQIEYDSQGLVLDVDAMNRAGRKLLTDDSIYNGRDCSLVVNELVNEICEAGYLKQKSGRDNGHVYVALENASVSPTSGFLDEISNGIRYTLDSHDKTRIPVIIESGGHTEKDLIGYERAKEIVFKNLDLTPSSAHSLECRLEHGSYELEFIIDRTKYNYTVDAYDARITDKDTDPVFPNDNWFEDYGNRFDDGDDRFDDDDDRFDDHDDRFDDDDDRFDDDDD